MQNPFAVISLSAALFATGAQAQEQRFTIQQTDNGYVRMDSETGQMSICTITSDQLVCKMAADERAAFDADMVALEDRIAALEAKIGGNSAPAADGLPSEEEFEQTLSYMERFMRRFMGIVEDFTDKEPAPDRT
jgi:hypothetical protein